MNNKLKKSEATKFKILKTAHELFLSEGYENSNITKIARRAGVAYGTVYTYFASKEDILAQILSEDILKKVDSIIYVNYSPETLEEARTTIYEQIYAFFQIAITYRKLLKIMYEAMGISANIREIWTINIAAAEVRISKDIERNKSIRLAKPNMDSTIAAKMLMGLINTLFWEIVMDLFEDIDQLTNYVVELYMFGLYNQPKIK